MTREEIKEIAKQVYKEEKDYQQLFKTMLAKSGKDINSMSDEDKKKFFSAVDKAYKAKTEGKLVESKKKDNLNEGFVIGLLSWIVVLGFVKLITVLLGRLAVSVVDHFQTASNNVKKENLQNIFGKISSNSQFIEDAAKLIDPKKGMDKTTVNKIVKMSFVQSAIDREIRDADIDKKYKKDFEDSLAQTLYKAWNDSSLMNGIVSKVKNEVK